jgi:putative spermidine/putrescine transport system permease protein/spermidine/putrescine transport system permease protein
MNASRPVRWLLGVVMAGALVILYGPFVYIVLASFFRLRRGSVQWDTFTFDWYAELWSNGKIIEALRNSAIVGFSAVFSALILGLVFALYFRTSRGRMRSLHQLVIFIPFLLPPIITGLSLLIYFRGIGLPRSLITVTIGHMVFVLALMYRTLLTRLMVLSDSLFEASYDLGANRRQTLLYVLLPNLRTAILTAVVLGLALSFDETLITLFLVGNDSTLPIRLWAMMRVGFTPEINALVTLIMGVTIVVSLVAGRAIRVPAADAER